ncbi:MAG: FAD-dependent oxidoreductase [Acidobacteriota bacterium]
MSHHDLIVIGAGNAYSIATRVADTGKNVVLVERDLLGGTCPNRGCVPSKLFLGFAEAAMRVRESSKFFMDSSLDSIDRPKILRQVLGAIGRTHPFLVDLLPEGVELVRGDARFTGERTVQVGDRELTADQVVIATGSRPRVPTIEGLEGTPFWTSDDVFIEETPPESIAIVGGGYIGCELAQFFDGIGVSTVLLHRGDRLLERTDESTQPLFQDGFTRRVSTRFDSEIVKVAHDGRAFDLDLRHRSGRITRLRVGAVLFAAGRVPNTDGLDAEKAGVELTSRGFVKVDDHLATTAEGVTAMGDVAGNFMFTHAARFEARYLSDQLTGKSPRGPIAYPPMPHAVFSVPELAGVGKTEQELREAGTEYRVFSKPYSTAAKGRAIKEEHGLCKFLLSPSGEILGCHLVGENASVLVQEVVTVMTLRNDIRALDAAIHIHPSLSEVVSYTAAEAVQELDA